MKKVLQSIGIAVIAASAMTAQAASTTATFNEVSSGAFTESFVVTPDAANTMVVRVTGMASQFSALSFSLWDGSTSVVSATASVVGGNYIALFSDVKNTTISLVGGKAYTLKVTGVSTPAPNSLGTVSAFNGTVTAVPEPESYAMLLAGLGLMGVVAKRRSRSTAA
ncbi:FxDxF family PEP-CTERM protein [Rhodoferax sp.]|uniref:FxDxF family PEP-CTERM protein n=1 Tax=Rhodoferax sp. TaxID=50421 RepID=UPI0025D28321|nr:FxDxF family PEP-CTERM protein [Rhodoferax sp.]